MTPKEAQDIYHKGRMAEYQNHIGNYTPVNQELTVLAGFQAVIDAVTKEVDNDYARKTLAMSVDYGPGQP